MKLKFLFCAAAAFLSAGCNDEDGSGDFGNLKFPDTGELDQTFKADQTSSRLTFEVAEAWTSEVVYGDSRADETTGWVSLSPDHGGAGRVTVALALWRESCRGFGPAAGGRRGGPVARTRSVA